MKSRLFTKSVFIFLCLLFTKGDTFAQGQDFGGGVDITFDYQYVRLSLSNIIKGKCDRCPGPYALSNDVSGRSSKAIKNAKLDDLFDQSKSYTLEVFRDGNSQIKAYIVNESGAKLPVGDFYLHSDDQLKFADLLKQANNKTVTVFDFKPSYKFEFMETSSAATRCSGKVSGTIQGLGVTLVTVCVDSGAKPQMSDKSMKEKGMKIKEH